MLSSEICYWVKTYTHTPTPPPNKKLIGFGSFEKVNLKLAGGVRTPGPPRPATPLQSETTFVEILTHNVDHKYRIAAASAVTAQHRQRQTELSGRN